MWVVRSHACVGQICVLGFLQGMGGHTRLCSNSTFPTSTTYRVYENLGEAIH